MRYGIRCAVIAETFAQSSKQPLPLNHLSDQQQSTDVPPVF
jgi:hypothetical protein